MNRRKKRWLWLGVVWGLALVVTGWNMTRISHIQKRRQELKILQMDHRYLEKNATDMDAVRDWRKRLTHRVESFDLGFLVVENDLKRLSERFNLSNMRIKAQKDFQDTRPVSIQVHVDGAMPALVEWLTTVEAGYPYLSVSKMEMKNEHRQHRAKMSATITYHYALSSTTQKGPI